MKAGMEAPSFRHNLAFGWGSTFASTVAGTMVTTALAVDSFGKTGSGIASAAVFALNWLPSLILAAFGGAWVDRLAPRRLWLGCELGCGTLTLLSLPVALGSNLGLLVGAILVRSSIEQLGRIAKTSALKTMFPASAVGTVGPRLQLAQYIGGAAAGFVSALLLAHVGMYAVLIAAGSLYLCAAALAAATREFVSADDKRRRPDLGSCFRTLSEVSREDVNVRRSVWGLAATAILFQGTYTVLLAVHPVQAFGLDAAAVNNLFGATGVAVVVGAVAYAFAVDRWRLPEPDERRGGLFTLGLTALAALLYLASVVTESASAALGAFITFIVLYEFVFLKFFITIVTRTPKEFLARVSMANMAIGTAGQSVASLAVGAALSAGASSALIVGVAVGLLAVVLSTVARK
jgi:hypothetical protein